MAQKRRLKKKMNKEKIEILEGGRLDKVLSQTLLISRNLVEEMISTGLVEVNGEQVKKRFLVKPGDEVLVERIEPSTEDALPEPMDLNIIYEDDDVLVIDKPRGIVVHPAPGNYTGTLVNGLLHYNPQLSCINGKYRPGIVHRIDKDTSGLLMIAKNDLAHRALAKELKEHTITRKYTALILGFTEEKSGEIDLPIGRDPKNRIKMAVVEGGKRAKTYYEVLEHLEGYTLIECQLETGRTHQIRVHLAYINHPVAGDPMYGRKTNLVPLEGQYLHAGVLGFTQPRTGEYLEFRSELPAYFKDKLEEIREV